MSCSFIPVVMVHGNVWKDIKNTSQLIRQNLPNAVVVPKLEQPSKQVNKNAEDPSRFPKPSER